mgnify:CR=1 FL=1
MKTLITVATSLALAGSAETLPAQADGLVAFPAVYSVQFENAWVRLVRVRVAGRANLGMHSHPAGFMVHVYLNDADPILFSHDGPPYEITRPAVTARSYRIGTATPEIHAVSNPSAGHTDYQRVEYKTTGFESSRERVFAPPLALTSSAVVEHTAEMSRVTRVTIASGTSAEFAATASEPAKLQVAREHGADHLIDSSLEDVRTRIKELTEGRGADVFYDPVGGELFDASLRSIAFEGRILAIGFASGTVPQIPANHLLVKNVDVIGINWPAYAELNPEVMTASFQTLMQWYLAGAIKPHVSAIYPLTRSAEALDRVVSRKATGKIVITMD